MPDIVLDLLKYAFLIVLYIFIARAVRAVYAELRPQPEQQPAMAPARGRTQERRSKKIPRKAAIVEGDSFKGKTFDVSDELIVGRADKCHVKLDDTYVSQMHARIFAKDGRCMVEDLGSTNGTYVNRRRITSPVELQRGDRVKVGKTVIEMRR